MKLILSLLLTSSLAFAAATPTLVWDANTDEIDGYNVYQDSILIGSVPIGTTSFILPFPLPPGRLKYTVTAYNIRGESLPADPVIVPATVPGKPVRVHMSLINGGVSTAPSVRSKAKLKR